MAYDSLLDNCTSNIKSAASISQYISDEVYSLVKNDEQIAPDKETEILNSLSEASQITTNSIKKRNVYRDIPSLSAKLNMMYINPGIAKMFK